MVVDAKICGITRAADAAFAAAHGAWRIGVIFAGGPREVTTTEAAEIVAAAGDVPVIGVFGPGPVGTMLERVAQAGLAGVQLHGAHGETVAGELRATGLEVWRVVPIGTGMDLRMVLSDAAQNVDAVLFEADRPGGSGGKGIPIALPLAKAAREAAGNRRVILAGGLTADSVGEAIRVVLPDAVDVSSGVEITPGVKDFRLVARFLENVRAARSAH
jgi:phosphoribosylanthranilate isomerase